MLLVSTILWLILQGVQSENITELKVGVLVVSGSGAPYDLERCGAAIDMALEDVNNQLLRNLSYRLVKVQQQFGPVCDASQAPGKWKNITGTQLEKLRIRSPWSEYHSPSRKKMSI